MASARSADPAFIHAAAGTQRYGYKMARRQVSLDVSAGQFVTLFWSGS